MSVLDLDKQTFAGPKYNGSHLVTSLARCKSLPTDSLIYMHLLSSTLKFYTRMAFLCQYSVLFRPSDDSKIDKFSNQSIQMPKSRTNTRKASIPVQSGVLQMSRREKILRFYSMTNNETTSPSSATSLLSSSIASIFGGSSSDTVRDQRKNSVTSSTSNDIDVELLRLVLAASSGTVNNSTSTSSSSLLFVTPTPVSPISSTPGEPLLKWFTIGFKKYNLCNFAFYSKPAVLPIRTFGS